MSSDSEKKDEELVDLLRQHDEVAFSILYERYWILLFRHANHMLKDESLAQDVLQEVFISLWSNASFLKPQTNLTAYLYKATRNRVLNILAQDKLRDEHLQHFLLFMEQKVIIPDEKLREKELMSILETELKDLPDKMREVFELSRIEQLSHQEIAEKLNITKHTVKSQINNVLKRLRNRLKILLLSCFLMF